MKKIFSFVWETAKIIIIALLIVVPIRTFLFQPFFVKGQSMDPNFENGDYLIIDALGTKDFNRIRLGICPQSGKPQDIEKFVLQNFTKTEEKILKQVIQTVIEKIGEITSY